MENRWSSAETLRKEQWRMRWAGWGLLVGTCILYAVTLDNGLRPEELVGGDLITHQYAQVQARPSNAPGYPLYTMGGWLWFHTLHTSLIWLGNPLPNPIPLLSSYSTFWALLAIWLLYRTICFLTRSAYNPAGAWPVAFLAAAFYSVTYFFWYYATTTEQYSSAIAQTLAILYIYLHWQEAQSNGQHILLSSRRPALLLLLLALLSGLSLAHMLTVAFIVPPLVLAILWQAPQLLRELRLVFMAIVAAFTPLLSYLYVYWRGSTHPEWWGQGSWATPQDWFWAFVSTAQGREELGWGFEPWCTPFANGFPMLIGDELSWSVVTLGVVGIALLERKQTVLLYATLIIYLAFAWAYRCGNWFQVILPAYPLLIVGAAQLWAQVMLKGGWNNNSIAKWHVDKWLYLILAIVVIWQGILIWPRADSRNRVEDSAFDRAATLVADPLPMQSHLFAAVNDALALQYLIQIWQVRPDLQVVSSPEAAIRLSTGASLYSTWEAAPTLLTELPATLHVASTTPNARWVHMTGGPTSVPLPAPTVRSEQELLPELTLQGYHFNHLAAAPLAHYRPTIAAMAFGMELTLFWSLQNQEWPQGVSISIRPTQGGTPLDGLQIDRTIPTTGLAQPLGPTVIDPYQFVLPEQVAAQVDGAMVILYRQENGDFENVVVLSLPWE